MAPAAPLLFLSFLFPTMAVKAQVPAGFEDVPVPITDLDAVKRVGSRFDGLVMPQPKENVLAQWSLRNSLKEKGNTAGEQGKLAALEQLCRDLGRAGLPEISSALAVEAAQQVEAGNPARALDLTRWSVRLSPAEPGALLAAAHVALFGYQPLEAGRLLLKWPMLVAQDPFQRQRILAALLQYAFPSSLVVVLVLLGAAGLRHRRLLAHDLGHFMPTGSSDTQRGLLVLLLLSCPLLLPCGAFGMLVCWSLLLGPYLRLSERVLAISGIFLLLFAPGLGTMLDEQLAAPGSIRSSIYRMQRGTHSAADEERVERAAQITPLDPVLRYSQALDAKRTGEIYVAATHLQTVLSQNPNHRQVMVLQAIVHLALHRVEAGRKTLSEVVRQWPDSAAAHFNLYRIAQVTVNEEIGGPRHLSLAQELSEATVDRLLADDSPGLNRFLMEDPLPLETILAWRGPEEKVRLHFHPSFAGWLWGSLPAERAPVMASSAIALLLLLWTVLASLRLRFSHPCQTCGQPLCRSCQPLVGLTSHCEICTPGLALFDGAAIVPSNMREKAQRDALARENRLAALLSLFAPGAGQVLQGRTWRGAFLLFLWFLLLSRLLLGEGCFGESLSWGVHSGLPLQAGLGVALFSLLVLGQLSVRRKPAGVG
ncbi:MAG: hypothetical protein FJ125_00030 [Deltaproteobacteria bacterium]|nr:hypothetical protein [Deltaproteobacteria bacterium]